MSTSSKWSFFFRIHQRNPPSPSIHDTWPAHLILLHLLAQILFGKNYKARSCSLCTIPQSHALYLHKVSGYPTDTHNISDTNEDVQFSNSWQASSISHCSYCHYCFIVTPGRNHQVEGRPLVGHPLLAQLTVSHAPYAIRRRLLHPSVEIRMWVLHSVSNINKDKRLGWKR